MKLLKTIFIIITAIATLIGAGFVGVRQTRPDINTAAATDAKNATVRTIREDNGYYESVSETESESVIESKKETITETEAYESVETESTETQSSKSDNSKCKNCTLEETENVNTIKENPSVTHTAKKYDGNISEDEYEFICTIVMAEAGAEPYEGIIAVTQCYLNAMKKENADAYTIHNMYGYAKGKTPDRNVRTIVYEVLYNGLSVTDEPILYFYAPALTYSAWHESQIFVMEIGGHRFFKERV